MARAEEVAKADEATLLAQITGIVTSGASPDFVLWKRIDDFPVNLDRGPNVRTKNTLHTARLALSILTEGQLSSCIGDTMLPDKYRVWAGQHRYDAVHLINEIELDRLGERKRRLQVIVSPTEFTPNQALRVQMAENLHEPMRPDEKSKVIQDLWLFYRSVHGENSSQTKFAKEIGRGEGEVRSAIRFSLLDERVQQIVRDGGFTFSFAVDHVARLPKDKQFLALAHIINSKMPLHKAVEYIKGLATQDSLHQLAIFSGKMAENLADQNFRISARNAADTSARDTALYYLRILLLEKQVTPGDRERMTGPIKELLALFIGSSGAFRQQLAILDPDILDDLDQRASELTKRFSLAEPANQETLAGF